MAGKYLLIGSSEAYSGKSAVVLGIAHRLQKRGLDISYGKPVGTCPSELDDCVDEDVRFIAQTLKLPDNRLTPTLLNLAPETIQPRIRQEDTTNYGQLLQNEPLAPGVDLALLEGPGTLNEGQLFDLSVPQMAEALDANVVLVCRYRSELVVDSLLAAQQRLGDRLVGVLINDVPTAERDFVETSIRPFLEGYGIPVLAILPSSALLRSVSVAQLVHQLKAEVLCCPERMDLLVESLKIGAMNVNSALKYFRKARNMAVVTGGDRTDLQLAALETSTHCLILTGQIPPTQDIVSRAEELEVPILSVDLDTLSTVEVVDRAFGQVRLHEPVKVAHIQQMMTKYFDCDRLLNLIGVRAPAKAG
ncbi:MULTISPECIES: DRTGG domain-containing protein [unclassified Leptolyngbya]|uniref:DRTGG domain-containing protein n=1 Tax=unclassified Leptolyngbya TaxID=2650499 RepID=UPI001682B517|nr:phosphotransacetylase family protein [Leptolyngbya sp. FACHB-8]MBD2153770.1 phosphotransacetylase family protein [Leptolyngbya sp. FACHB-16]